MTPPKAVKNNLGFWGPALASLFSYIDNMDQIPEAWGSAIIVPVFKKDNRDGPTNCTPISLLSNISKLYAWDLSGKLKDWLEQEEILTEEQAGFRKGRTTTISV